MPQRAMQDYRVFVIGLGGHVIDRFEFWCQNDEEAKEKAQQLLGGQDGELWQQGRRIAEFKSASSEAASVGGHFAAIPRSEPAPVKGAPKPEPTRSEKVLRVIGEYANNLREIIRKLRRKFN
jgi:hypothetical protein